MKYKPWGWVDVFKDGRIQVGTTWQEWQEETAGYIRFSPDVTGGEELVTEEIKTVMAALDLMDEYLELPCGSHYIDGFALPRGSHYQVGFSFVGSSTGAITGTIPVRTYFIYLGEQDEI